MAPRINPTFLLKGVDPDKLLADYLSGFFSRPIKSKGQITIAKNGMILAPTYGVTNNSPIFTLKDRNNCSVIIATSGHVDYEIFTRTGGRLPEGGRCDRCKEDFTHTAMGYPIGYQEQTVLTTDTQDPKQARYRTLYIFWVEKCFCSFECALGYVRLFLNQPAEYRDSTIRDSERMLKILYKLTYPTAPPLRPSQDPSLLITNKGSLTREDWQDSRHIYIRTDRILMIPAKVEYVQQNFINPVIAMDLNRDIGTVVAPSS